MKKFLTLILAVAITAAVSACGSGAGNSGAQTDEARVIRVGVVGENTEHWQPVIEKMAEEGVSVELVKFSDYTVPNQALADGELELNAFQHYAFLNNEVADKGLDLVVVGESIIAPLGLFSDKITSISEIADGDKIAIPNDATNGGRALKVIESAGLIGVDPAAGYTPEVSNITDNPLNLEFIQVEAALTASLLPDVTAAIINGGHAADHGLNPTKDSIYLEQVVGGNDNPYINIIVSRAENADDEVIQRIVEVFQSDEVAAVIDEVYAGVYIPAWK